MFLGAAVLAMGIAVLIAGIAAPGVARAAGPPGGTGWYPAYTPTSVNPIYKYYENGVYAGKMMEQTSFQRMLDRAGLGVQSLGTGSGSGYPSNASNGASVASELKTISSTAATAATVRSLKGDTVGLMTRLKSFGALKTLGTIGLGITAFEVGYSIGGKISDFFFGHDESAGCGGSCGTAYAFQASPILRGEEFTTSGLAENLHAKAPSDGFQIEFKLANKETRYDWFSPEPAPSCTWEVGSKAPPDTPPEAVPVSVGTEFCPKAPGYEKGLSPMVAYFLPAQVSCLPGDTGDGCPGSPKTTKGGTAQTPVSAGQARTVMEECFLALVACGKFPAWWWNHDPEAKQDTISDGQGSGLEPSDPLLVRVPKFGRHEKYSAYEAKLEALELTPEAIELPAEYINPAYGPEEVTQVNPKPTTQLVPESVVKVRYNPASATEVTPGQEGEAPGTGGPWSPPGIPAIDLAPLAETGLGCDVFPFGLPCYVYEVVASLNVAPVCPQFEVPLYDGNEMHIDSCIADPILNIWRPVFLFVATVSIVWMFASFALGGRGED